MRLPWLAALWLTCVPGEVWSYAYSTQTLEGVLQGQTEGEPVIWRGPQAAILLRFGPGFDESAAMAMQEWSRLGTFNFVPQTSGAGSPCDAEDRQNVAGWQPMMCGGAQFGDALAATSRTYVLQGNRYWLSDVGIFFDSARNWTPRRPGPLMQDSLGVDFYRIMLHELGHALGLDHPDKAGQNVDAIMNSRAGPLDTLQADDKSGYERLYGTATASSGSVSAAAPPAKDGGGGVAWGLALLAAAALPRQPTKTKRVSWKTLVARAKRKAGSLASR